MQNSLINLKILIKFLHKIVNTTKITLKRAKKELNIQTEKVRSNGKFKEIIWKLPDKKQACSVFKPEPITSNFDAKKETKKRWVMMK